MHAINGDPDDVTRERMPFILEKVKLAAGEFAAASVRAESEQREAEIRKAHDEEIERLRKEVAAAQAAADGQVRSAQSVNLQYQQHIQEVSAQNIALHRNIVAQAEAEDARKKRILQAGLKSAISLYRRLRWYAALLFGIAVWLTTIFSTVDPVIGAGLSGLFAVVGFWFVPDHLDKPINWYAMKHLRTEVAKMDPTLEIPTTYPNFNVGYWDAMN